MNAQDALDRLSTIYDRQLRPAEAVAEAMSIYLEMGARIDELDVIRATAKQVIGDVLAEVGTDKLETDAGLAYITKPSVRVSYDTKGLDRLGEVGIGFDALVRLQSGFVRQCPDDILTGQNLIVASSGHFMQSCKAITPRRIQLFAVPSGTPRRSASSPWLNPCT